VLCALALQLLNVHRFIMCCVPYSASKPSVRFTDSLGGVFAVPAASVVAVIPTTSKPTPPPNPCVGVVTDERIGDGVCDAALNLAPCWDGGDCCEATCQGTLCGDKGYNCKDVGRDPITGLAAPGAWAAHYTGVAAATVLASQWTVDLSIAASLGLPDGALTAGLHVSYPIHLFCCLL